MSVSMQRRWQRTGELLVCQQGPTGYQVRRDAAGNTLTGRLGNKMVAATERQDIASALNRLGRLAGCTTSLSLPAPPGRYVP
jgi:hypothetical protein